MNSQLDERLRDDALEFFMKHGVLSFGEFTLKSGRSSPYFFNTGLLSSGEQLGGLGELYARRMQDIEAFNNAGVIFGSAYKGIPIAVSTAIAMRAHGRGDLRAVSDRKEAKTHGDVSAFLGVIESGDRAVIVDDVISTGGTKLEAIEKLRDADVTPLGLIIALDRGEPMTDGGPTAREAFEQQTGLPVYPLLSVHDIIEARADLAPRLREHLETFA